MRNKWIYKMTDSVWFKVLGLLALILTGATAVYAGTAGIFMYEYGINGQEGSYFESQRFQESLLEDAHQIESFYDSGHIENAERVFSIGERNVQYRLETYEKNGKFTVVSENKGPADWYRSSIVLTFGVLQEGYHGYSQYYYTGDLSTMPEGYNGYRVTMYVRDGLPVEDSYRTDCIYYESLVGTFASPAQAMGVFAGSMVLFTIALILEFTGAGHQPGKEGITLSWIDRIPMDVLTVLVGLGTAFIMVVSEMVLKESWVRNAVSFADRMIPFCAVLASGGVIIFFWLMSFAARIKAGTLWRNNLWYMVFARITDVLKEYEWPMRIVLLAACAWIALAPAWFGRRYFSEWELLLAFMISVICACLMLYMLAAHRILAKAANEIAGGNTDYRIGAKEMKFMFGSALAEANALNSIGSGLETAVNQAMRSERMKTELITNVSHDIKTPLTSIISYTDLLQKEHTKEQEQEYLEALSRQSIRLKKLTEDIVEASKASSGAITAEIKPVNINELLDQALGEYSAKLSSRNIEPVLRLPEETLCAEADGRLLWRVLNNLLSNVEKYAMSGTRVYLSAENENGNVRISVKNISEEPLNIGAEELMERFVRGDASRHTEGTGLGLNIARSLVELMNGTFELFVDGDLFRADILLKESVCEPK